MQLVRDDGGRQAAGYAGRAGDCVVRAIAIGTGLAYEQVRQMVVERMADLYRTYREKGVPREVYQDILTDLGWRWVPTMRIGQGCRVHLRADELPRGRLICRVSRHLVAVVDGVIHDTGDPSRGGRRCVYGYFEGPDRTGSV